MITQWAAKLLGRFGTVAMAGYIGWLGWTALGPRKPEMGPVRRKMADQAVEQIVESVRRNRGEVQSAVLLYFANDPSDQFTDQLRLAIEQQGILDLHDRSLMEKVRNQLQLRHPICSTADEASAVARGAGTDAALFGAINRFESYPGGARIDVNYWLVGADGTVIYPGTYVKHTNGDPPAVAPEAAEAVARTVPWFKRGLAWLVAVLLLPVFTIAFIRAMVRKESNKTNAMVLGIYTLVDAILAYLLLGAALAGFWSVFFFALAVVGSFAYNARIMAWALKLEVA
jgi:hypothetical protein